MGTLLSYPKFFATDSSTGLPLVGGKLYTYINGSTTVEKASYSDRACASVNTNPVILNARGEATIYLTGLYNLILKDSDDNTIWSMDNVEGTPQGSYTFYPSASEADHGATSTGGSLKDILTSIGTSTKATVIFLHSGAAATTSYTVATTYDASSYSNVKFVFENGAVISVDSGKTLTFPSPANISASINQQIFSGSGTVSFSKKGVVYPQWWGADPIGTTESSTACLAAVNSGAGIVDGCNGLFYLSAKISLVSNVTVRNMRVFDTDYRTTGHPFFESIGTLGSEKTDLAFENLEILGNNSTYAALADGHAYNIYSVIDAAAIFCRYCVRVKIRDVFCRYMVLGCSLQLCSDADVDGFESYQVEDTYSYSGFTFGACYDSYGRNIRIHNGGDGGLYIYNGVNCHISDSMVEITGTPATYSESGAGIESCTGCSLTRVKSKNCWVGISVVEAVVNGSVTDCIIEGCQTGILLSPFGVGNTGHDVALIGNKIVEMTDLGGASYPVSGICFHNDNVAYPAFRNVRIIGNYVGRSTDGTPLWIEGNATTKPGELIVNGNTFEALSYTQLEWESQAGGYNNSEHECIYLKYAKDVSIIGNILRQRADVAPDGPALNITYSSDINVLGNHFYTAPTATPVVKSDANSSYIQITNNYFYNLDASATLPFSLSSTRTIVKDNKGWTEICVLPVQLSISVSDYAKAGYNHFFSTALSLATLPPAVAQPLSVGGYATDPMTWKFTCVAIDTFTIYPQAGELIRGEAVGAGLVLTPGQTKTFYCIYTGAWEYF